jgi:nickel/cobalt transporter (NicO) family protein
VKKLLVLLALALPAPAGAHPLGNFTINQFSSIQPSGDRIYVHYVADFAEIPAFQELQKLRAEPAYNRRLRERIAAGLELSVGGKRVPLAPVEHTLAFPSGAAGLRTMRLELVLRTPALQDGASPVALRYRDTNFGGRLGWKEIVLEGSPESVRSSSVPRRSISEGLVAYPEDMLSSPLRVTEAEAAVVLNGTPGPPPALRPVGELERRVAGNASADGGLAGLIGRDELSPGFVLLSLALAFFWGAAHAFSPGHGKAIVAGYLVGSRGTPRHAVLLGLIVTVTHTIGVFALGLVTLALSAFIVPEQLYPWLNLASALLVVAVGLAILRWRIRVWRGHRDHGHGHTHDHAHSHDHRVPGKGGLLGIGISAGIVPCPTALVVLLAAISLQRVGYGLVLIVAFSLGLALSVIGIGLIAVTAQRRFSRMTFNGPVLRALPALSAFAVIGVGLVMALTALPQIL